MSREDKLYGSRNTSIFYYVFNINLNKYAAVISKITEKNDKSCTEA